MLAQAYAMVTKHEKVTKTTLFNLRNWLPPPPIFG
jgi:hypothetical protein